MFEGLTWNYGYSIRGIGERLLVREVVFERSPQSLGKIDLHAVSQIALGGGDVGPRILYVSGTWRREMRIKRLVQLLTDFLQ